MSREEIITSLIEFASEVFGVDAANIHEDTNISEELGKTSMQRIGMAASIEEEFDVMIPVARFGNYRTIGDLADYIMEEL